MPENKTSFSIQDYNWFVKSKEIISLRKIKKKQINPAYRENFPLRREIFQRALASKNGEFFFIARKSSQFQGGQGNPLFDRDTASILLCKSEQREMLMEYAKKDNDVNLSQTGYLTEDDILKLFPTGLRADCFGLTEETKRKFCSAETTDKTAPHGDYIPKKEDCERVIEQLKNASKTDKIHVEEVLDLLAKQFQEKGILLKDNWRLLIEESFKFWFPNQ